VAKAKKEREEYTPDALHALVRSQFEEYVDGTITMRALAIKCRDYRDGNQLSDAERKVLKRRNQPAIIDNKIQDKCDTLLGIEKQMRTDPKAFPRTPAHEDAAEAATDALRYVADCNDYQRAVRKPAADNLMVEGLCAGHVIVQPKKGKPPKVAIEHIRWDRLYYDIRSLRNDFTDKTYCGLWAWMDEDAAELEFDPAKNKLAHPDALKAIDASFADQSLAGADRALDDKPIYAATTNGRKRLQVFETYFLHDGVWKFGKWCQGGWLETARPSPYVDEDGQPSCAIEIEALYRDSDGNPYGSVQRYLDLQDEHNKRRSKMLHLLNSKRIVYRAGTLDDPGKVRNEVHKPDGMVEVKGDPADFRVEDNLAESAGQWQLLQQTEAALAATGPNAALAGQSGQISGRAKQLDQVSGSLPISPLFDALEAWETRMYRQAWMRIRQFWTAEMWVRVTDNDKGAKFVPLNQPVLHGDVIAEQLKADPRPPEEKAAILSQLAQDPAAQMPVMEGDRPKIKNEVARMDVDIIIDRSPDTVTIQQEQFEQLATLAEKGVPIPPAALIEASSIRNKRQMLDQMSGKDDPAAKMQARFLQMMQQLQAALMDAKVRRENAAAAKDEAATVESQVDASVKVATFTTPPDPAEAGATGKTQVSVN